MVNARTIAIGTFALVGAGILAADSMSDSSNMYTKYIIDDETTLYVNNDYTPISEADVFHLIGDGDLIPESGNAGFVEKTRDDLRLLIGTSYGIIQEFQGGVETSCGPFLPEENPEINVPEHSKYGDFSEFGLVNGIPSSGPAQAIIDPRDCSSGRELIASEERLMERSLKAAEKDHGVGKRSLNTIKEGFLNCNMARENAIKAYYDEEVGQYNQCSFNNWYYSSEERRLVFTKFTRVSGSQLSAKDWVIDNTLADWSCNLGYEGRSKFADFVSKWLIPQPDPIWLFGVIWKSLMSRDSGEHGHVVEKGKGNWGAGGGRVKSCYADYARKSEPCIDPAAKHDSGVTTNCVGHSLGGGTCAVGKGLDMWYGIIGMNPVPSVTKSFEPDGSSFRYTWGHDIASFCFFKTGANLEWGFSAGVRTYERKCMKRTKSGRRNWQYVACDVGENWNWPSDACVEAIFPISMFMDHSSSKTNHRCPGESLTAGPSQLAWMAANTGDPPKGPQGPVPYNKYGNRNSRGRRNLFEEN